MNEIVIGFVDDEGLLINTAIVNEGDEQTILRIKQESNAENAYIFIPNNNINVNEAKWNGTRFIHPSPFPSWIFNEEINNWVAPTPYPTVDPENPKSYEWNEELLNWEEISE